MKLFCIKIKTFCLLLILFGCEVSEKEKSSRVNTLPYYQEATFTPYWLEANDNVLNSIHQIPAFELDNQDGEQISEKTFQGKIYVSNFFFTSCPGICPKMADNMKVLQEQFLDDTEVLLLSHSVTPEKDSVPVLKTYAETNGVKSGKWHLATGRQEDIYNLGRKSYFVEEDLGLIKEADEFLHTENFVLIDKNRHIRGIYNGLNTTSVQQLIEDIQTLKKEGVLVEG